MQKKFISALIIVILIYSSGCTYEDTPKTTDLLKVDDLSIYPGNVLNTNDLAQIRMRVSNTGQDDANLILEERKIKRYNLWEKETAITFGFPIGKIKTGERHPSSIEDPIIKYGAVGDIQDLIISSHQANYDVKKDVIVIENGDGEKIFYKFSGTEYLGDTEGYYWENSPIFREGNTWFKWDGENRQRLSYAEYIMDGEDKVTIIDQNRDEQTYVNLASQSPETHNPDNYITLVSSKYTKEDYDLDPDADAEILISYFDLIKFIGITNQDEIDRIAAELKISDKAKTDIKTNEWESVFSKYIGLPEKITDDDFLASSVFTRHCGSLYKINKFNMYPSKSPPLEISSEVQQKIGNTEYSKYVVAYRYITISPRDSVELVWDIQAPSNEQTMGLTQPCKFGFNVKYCADAKSQANIYFANPIEIIQGKIADEEIDIEGTTVQTYGPLEIQIEPTAQQPIRSSTKDEDYRFTLKLDLLNKGAGIGHIKNLKLKVNDNGDIFENIKSSGEESSDYYCDFKKVDDNELTIKTEEDGDEGKMVFNKLKIYKGKTSQISCTLDAPKVNLVKPFRFTAEAEYDYIIEGWLVVKTKPDKEI